MDFKVVVKEPSEVGLGNLVKDITFGSIFVSTYTNSSVYLRTESGAFAFHNGKHFPLSDFEGMRYFVKPIGTTVTVTSQ